MMEAGGFSSPLRHQEMEDHDAWEAWPDDLYNPARARRVQARLRIMFIDRNGVISYRTIVTERYFHQSGQGTLIAFCELRQARRPFAFDRIHFAADLSSAQRIRNLPAWLDDLYLQSPIGKADAYIQDNDPALTALFFVAKADAAFRAKEKQIMRDYMAATGLHDDGIQTIAVSSIAERETPSATDYGKALKILATMHDESRRLVLQHAEAIVSSDKTIRDDELRALSRMRKALFPAAQRQPATE